MEAVADTEPVSRYDVFEFTGDGGEYFRIWIVNLLLSIVTFGIYSAWAKVRRLEYFYRHTHVAGATFDYHGRPLAILKGRLVAAVLFGTYYAATLVSPLVALPVAVALAAVMPWLLNRSLMFRFHNSSYRGLRFHFHGSTAEAYWVLLGLPLLSVFTVFMLVPFWHQRLKRYQHGNAAFGQTRFIFDAPIGSFYKVYAITVLMMVGLVALFFFFFFLSALVIGMSGASRDAISLFITAFVLVFYVVVALSLGAAATALIQNVVWRHTSLGPYRFSSTLEAHRLLLLRLTNTLKVLVTFGLYKPFADIRMMRYMAGEMTLVGPDSMDVFAADEFRNLTAVGEEAAEMFDIDFAF